MASTGQTANARYGRIVLRIYLAFNGLLLVATCIAAWYFATRANSRGIAPNTTLGFRSQHTLASLHGWYVAQRVGFHFAAVAVTLVTVAVFAIVAVAVFRRANPTWIVILPIIGQIASGACFAAAGQKADQAAVSVERTAATATFEGSSVHRSSLMTAGLTNVNCGTSEPCLH